jgi:carbamoyltransferase
MYTLGINAYVHDACAALVCDGEVVAMAEEERFDRKKHSGAFPSEAARYCLESAGIGPQDLHAVGFYVQPWLYWRMIVNRLRYMPRSLRSAKGASTGSFMSFLRVRKDLAAAFPGADVSSLSVRFVPHHLCHAASAFLLSGFDEAAILSIDASGEWATTQYSEGHGRDIKVLQEISFPHSLGILYSAATQYLGFRRQNCEGKIMGLAPYGEPRYIDTFREIIALHPQGEFRLDLSYFSHQYGEDPWSSPKWVDAFGPAREWESEISQVHEDVAASLQLRTEEVADHLARHLKEITSQSRLCLCGGVALNSVMNGKIAASGIFDEIFIQPAAGDAGTGLGAALWIDAQQNPDSQPWVQTHASLGPEYADEEIVAALECYKLEFRREDDICQEAARLLSEGAILGWFQGRMEVGPRALGNRSILADPRSDEMKDILNRKVKHREPFRPFAPSVLADRAGDFFTTAQPSPFMLLVCDVKPDKRDVVPAITHVDGTARVQTVERQANPRYYDMIEAFGNLTGVPMVLNTSFNVRGEPIVNSPEDAVKCFMGTGIDYLVIGDFVATKTS